MGAGGPQRLCLTGDPPSAGDHPQATGVFDLDVLGLVRLAVGLRERGRLANGDVIDPAPTYFVGVAELPLADPYDPSRLEAKAEAGADFVQTQIVYDVDAFGEWAERVRPRGSSSGCTCWPAAPPRGPGSLRFMREHLYGVVVPDALVDRLEAAGPDGPRRACGRRWRRRAPPRDPGDRRRPRDGDRPRGGGPGGDRGPGCFRVPAMPALVPGPGLDALQALVPRPARWTR